MPDSIEQNVQALFENFLEDVETAGSEIKGKNAIGRFFIFNRTERESLLILGEVSLEAARSRLRDLLLNKHDDISTVSQKINTRINVSRRGKNSLLIER